MDGGVMVAGHVVQPGPSLALADGDGDAGLAAGVVRPGPREPHHAEHVRGPEVRYRKGRDCLLRPSMPGALRGRAAAGLYTQGRLGRRQAVAAPAGRAENGFTVKPLSNGDCIVTIRHDGCRDIVVEGDDPQESVRHDRLQYKGLWATRGLMPMGRASSTSLRTPARARLNFTGNQVRLIGRRRPDGGKADVYLDGVKQLCGIDFWCPQTRDQQVLCYKNGLTQGKHRLEIVARARRIRSRPTRGSASRAPVVGRQGESGFGPGGGPADTQRVIFGYVGRKDYVDSGGSAWRPATEFIMRLGTMADLVPASFWTEPQLKDVAGTPDPELYRYGVYGRDFTAYFTVSPRQSYHVRLKFCQAHKPSEPGGYATNIEINGRPAVTDMDMAATAGGLGHAADLVFNDVRPQHGVIAIRFLGTASGPWP